MKKAELELLRDKCLLFNQFLSENGGFPSQMIEAFKESNNLINKAFSEGDIKPLKIMDADIDDQINRHMSQPMAQALKSLLKSKLNIDFDDKVRIEKIDKILRDGVVSTRDEYELIVNRIDELYADGGKENEIKDLNTLIIEYEKRDTDE